MQLSKKKEAKEVIRAMVTIKKLSHNGFDCDKCLISTVCERFFEKTIPCSWTIPKAIKINVKKSIEDQPKKTKRITEKTFAKFIKNLRLVNGLSQKDLSEVLKGEISVRTIEGWETGRKPAPGLIAMLNFLIR